MSIFNILFRSKAQYASCVEVLNVAEFKEAVNKKNIQLVDVRTAREFKGGHIARAVNIDYFQGAAFKEAFEKMDRKKPVYLYCRSGNRSNKAAYQLAAMGFEKVYDLKGGILRW